MHSLEFPCSFSGMNFFSLLRPSVLYFIPFFFQGAATSIYCVLAPEVVAHSGEYFDSCQVGSASASAKDDKLADELEALSRRFLQDKGFL
jgi:hypothetical protein